MVHVHDVLNWIREKQEPVSVEEIKTTFGTENRFTNCKEDNFSIDQIIQFMISRGKVEILPDGSISALDIPPCEH